MKIAALENLARDMVGDGVSAIAFVNVEGRIAAVFNASPDSEVNTLAAIDYASMLDSEIPCFVENRDGVAWDNDASDRLQMVDE